MTKKTPTTKKPKPKKDKAPEPLKAGGNFRYLRLLCNTYIGVYLSDDRDPIQKTFPGYRVVRVVQAIWDKRLKQVIEITAKVYGGGDRWNGPKTLIRRREQFVGSCVGVIDKAKNSKCVPIDQYVKTLYKIAKENPEVAKKRPDTVPTEKTIKPTVAAAAEKTDKVVFEEDPARDIPTEVAESFDGEKGIGGLPFVGLLGGIIPPSLIELFDNLLKEKAQDLDIRPATNDTSSPTWWLTVGNPEKPTFYYLVGYGPSQPKPIIAEVLYIAGIQRGTAYIGGDELGADPKGLADFIQSMAVDVRELWKVKPITAVVEEPEAEALVEEEDDKTPQTDDQQDAEDPLSGFDFLKGI